MQVFLNELAFSGQATSIDHAAEILHQIIEIANTTKALRGNSIIKRHTNLKHAILFQERSIHEVVFQDLAKMPKYKPLVDLFIQFFMKGPFFDQDVANIPATQIVDSSGESVGRSCLAAALLSPTGGAVISPQSTKFTMKLIPLECSIRGRLSVRNYNDVPSASADVWIYQPHTKHAIAADKVVKGGHLHSKMDLDDKEAQRALSCGIMHNGHIYSKVEGKWYIFRHHDANFYHGHPMKFPRDLLPKDVEDIWQMIVARNEGQVFLA